MIGLKIKSHTHVENDLCNISFCYNSADNLIELINNLIAEKMQQEIITQKEQQKKLVEKYLFNLGSATHASVQAIKHELKI